MPRNQNWNRDGWNRNDSYSSPGSYTNYDSPAEGERMTYAKEQGYGSNINSRPSSSRDTSSRGNSGSRHDNGGDYRLTSQRDTQDSYRNTFQGEYQDGLNQFERGRKASRDYDRDYTGYRSSNDEGDTGHERERWSSQRYGNEPTRHGADYGSVARQSSMSGQMTGQMPGQMSGQMSGPMYDGRDQGYRNPEAQYRASSAAGKGPKGWKRTDERIREDVCHVLEGDHVVDATEIEVTVKDGVVTLSGHTETRPVKRRAEDIIENVAGVKDVRNELSVDQSLFQQAKDFILGESEPEKKTSKSMPAPKH